MRFCLLLLPLFLLSACGDATYAKPGASPTDAEKAQNECDYEAEKATASMDNPFLSGQEEFNISNRCMQVKGYRMVR